MAHTALAGQNRRGHGRRHRAVLWRLSKLHAVHFKLRYRFCHCFCGFIAIPVTVGRSDMNLRQSLALMSFLRLPVFLARIHRIPQMICSACSFNLRISCHFAHAFSALARISRAQKLRVTRFAHCASGCSAFIRSWAHTVDTALLNYLHQRLCCVCLDLHGY